MLWGRRSAAQREPRAATANTTANINAAATATAVINWAIACLKRQAVAGRGVCSLPAVTKIILMKLHYFWTGGRTVDGSALGAEKPGKDRAYVTTTCLDQR